MLLLVSRYPQLIVSYKFCSHQKELISGAQKRIPGDPKTWPPILVGEVIARQQCFPYTVHS